MPRAKGGPKTRRRRKKILKQAKGFVGGRRKLYRTAAETVLRAGAFAYRHRKPQKAPARAARGCRRVRAPQAEEAHGARALDRTHQRGLPRGRPVLLALHGRAEEGGR